MFFGSGLDMLVLGQFIVSKQPMKGLAVAIVARSRKYGFFTEPVTRIGSASSFR
jgi:hypothetical protein